jgi:DNA-binding MarR family transcriptional regulator
MKQHFPWTTHARRRCFIDDHLIVFLPLLVLFAVVPVLLIPGLVFLVEAIRHRAWGNRWWLAPLGVAAFATPLAGESMALLWGDGLTTQQAALLTVVSALDGPSLNEAAAALGSTHQNVAQLVAALQRKKLLRTEPDPADRRRVRLFTTETNQRYWRGRDQADAEAVAQWFAVLSDEEIETFCTLANRILDGLDAHRTAARLRR